MHRTVPVLVLIAGCALAACSQAASTDPAPASERTAPTAAVSTATPAARANAPAARVASGGASTDDARPRAGGNGSWRYGQDGAGASARHFAQVPGRVEGAGAVTLEFASSGALRRQAMLEGLAAPADCEAGCRVEISVDGAAGERVHASPHPDAATTLTLRDARGLWQSLAGARELVITFPGADGQPQRARFDVGGLDPAALPGWMPHR